MGRSKEIEPRRDEVLPPMELLRLGLTAEEEGAAEGRQEEEVVENKEARRRGEGAGFFTAVRGESEEGAAGEQEKIEERRLGEAEGFLTRSDASDPLRGEGMGRELPRLKIEERLLPFAGIFLVVVMMLLLTLVLLLC